MRSESLGAYAVVVCLCFGVSGCGSEDEGGSGIDKGGSGGVGATGGTGPIITQGGASGAGGASAGGSGPYVLPPGFTPATSGGWQTGDEITGTAGTAGSGGSGGTSGMGCGTTLLGVVRDFRAGADDDGNPIPDGHPDFETFTGTGDQGMVSEDLGADYKPVYTDDDDGETPYTTTQENFDQWYVTLDDVNRAYELRLSFEPQGNGVFTFDSDEFFPLDDE